MKKTTLATIKKFIRENKNDLYVMEHSRFDGMVDCVMRVDHPKNVKVDPNSINFNRSNTFGIPGAWFVCGSRNYFQPASNQDGLTGYHISNCTGSFSLMTTVKG